MDINSIGTETQQAPIIICKIPFTVIPSKKTKKNNLLSNNTTRALLGMMCVFQSISVIVNRTQENIAYIISELSISIFSPSAKNTRAITNSDKRHSLGIGCLQYLHRPFDTKKLIIGIKSNGKSTWPHALQCDLPFNGDFPSTKRSEKKYKKLTAKGDMKFWHVYEVIAKKL